MPFLASLRRLWRHRLFRRLLAVRVATQSCDGLLQIALASYVLFSPERQPDAAAIAAVLAVTLLPFSILGPFVGIVLDRFSRRQILVVVDLSRAVIAVGLALLVLTGVRDGLVQIAFYGLVLLAQSLNRFLLAALSAALPHTIDDDEYLVANAVVPTVGPAGVLIGAGLGTVLRLITGSTLPANQADALLFAVAVLGYVLSASLALRIPRDRLGPDDVRPARAREVVSGLVAAVAHLRERRPAGIGLLTIGAHRVVYGIVTVATILVYRNFFHAIDDVEPAIADLGLLVVVTGAGFVLAAVVTPPLVARIGARAWMVTSLAASAFFQLLPGAIYTRITLLVAALLLGVTAQSIKIVVDTFVQAYVDDDVKGRVFVLYDMIFNVALVAAAGIGALILPVDGVSVPILVVLAAVYLATAVAFAVITRGLDLSAGTESMRRADTAADA